MPAYDPFPWLRLWNKTIHDPKVMGLSGRLFKAWIVCLCVANGHKTRGQLPSIEILSFSLRQPICKGKRIIDHLIKRGLIDRGADGLSIHNWQEYQAPRDTNAARQRRYRERHKGGESNVTGNVTVTPPPVTKRTENREQRTENPPSSSTDAGANADAGVDDGGRAGLESWAKQTLGDRFDLENLGPNLAAWSLAYPRDWIRLAVESAVRARPGGLAAYAHRILARSHAAGRCVVADTLAPPPPAGTNGTGHVSKSQAAVDNWTRYLETKEQGKEAHDAPG